MGREVCLAGESKSDDCGKADGWRAGVRVTSSLVGNDGSSYTFEQAGNLLGPPPTPGVRTVLGGRSLQVLISMSL